MVRGDNAGSGPSHLNSIEPINNVSMKGLPELPDRDGRRIEGKEPEITRAVAELINKHGERLPKGVGSPLHLAGMRRSELEDGIAVHARRLLRLYAVLYLDVAPANQIEHSLLTRLRRRIQDDWLFGLRPNSAAALLAVAEAAMRDEFKTCCRERQGNSPLRYGS